MDVKKALKYIVMALLISSCDNMQTTTNNPKTLKTENCSTCNNSQCETTCSSNPHHDTLEGQRLKELIPSCNLSSASIIDRKNELNERGIFLKVAEIKEISDGYDFVFHEPKEFSQEILDYINFERNCCSNFSFAIEFEPNEKATHLKIFGTNGVKKQIKNAIDELNIGKK